MTTKRERIEASEPQVSFTLLVDDSDMRAIKAIARECERTKGYVVREAIKKYINGRKRA